MNKHAILNLDNLKATDTLNVYGQKYNHETGEILPEKKIIFQNVLAGFYNTNCIKNATLHNYIITDVVLLGINQKKLL